MRNRHIVAGLLAIAACTANAECPAGKDSFAQGVWVVFTKSPVVPPQNVQVRWFHSNGEYADSFTATANAPTPGNPLKMNFPPGRVYLDSSLTAGCVSGTPVWQNNHCYARYELPWAGSTYSVTITAPQGFSYVVHRLTPREKSNSFCTQALRDTSNERFSGDETLAVSLLSGTITLITSTVNLADGARRYEIDENRLAEAFREAEKHGQTGGPISPNARWLARKKASLKQNVNVTLNVALAQ